MIYRKLLGARKRGVSLSRMPQEPTVPESRPHRPTLPPGESGAELAAFEARIKERDEQTARLENLARVYGFSAVR